MTASAIELRDLHVTFRARGAGRGARVHAVTDVDFHVEAGETVGVVGESGCGKSTLAKVIVGLQQPTAGTVGYFGKDLWSMPTKQRRRHIGSTVGMVFQDPSMSLNRRMPIGQILRDPLDIHGWKSVRERTARVRELLGLVGLPSSALAAFPSDLSGGQRQRVSIARALALEPRILVADEPTSALDVSVRAQVLNLLMDLKAQLGLSMVYISHDIQTVRHVSDRVVTMYLGRIVESTPSAAIEADTRHPYTRALLSATPSVLAQMEPIPLVGPVPSAVNPPSGCAFRTRCWRAGDECAAEVPERRPDPADDRHMFSCLHPVLSTADLPVGR